MTYTPTEASAIAQTIVRQIGGATLAGLKAADYVSFADGAYADGPGLMFVVGRGRRPGILPKILVSLSPLDLYTVVGLRIQNAGARIGETDVAYRLSHVYAEDLAGVVLLAADHVRSGVPGGEVAPAVDTTVELGAEALVTDGAWAGVLFRYIEADGAWYGLAEGALVYAPASAVDGTFDPDEVGGVDFDRIDEADVVRCRAIAEALR